MNGSCKDILGTVACARAVLLFLLLAPAASGDEWYDAYARGVEALDRGEPRKAIPSLERAVHKRPEPGTNLITYGTNRLGEYAPYLSLADAYVQVGKLDEAREALKRSELFAKEPVAWRAKVSAEVEAASRDATLLKLPRDGQRHELVEGELRLGAGDPWRELVVASLIERLAHFAAEHRLGRVFASNVKYGFPSGNRRSPDASFVAAGRLPPGRALRQLLLSKGVFEIVPDLVVEVVPPGGSPREVLDKVGEYLQTGVRLVWVIDPVEESALAYTSLMSVRRVPPGGSLEGADILPGFVCPLGDLFE
jgi:Uma2 family endonuclease